MHYLIIFVGFYSLVLVRIVYDWSLATCPIVQRSGMCLCEAFDGDVETFGSTNQLMGYKQHWRNWK